MAFMNDVFKHGAQIGLAQKLEDGFEIETDMGCSFTIEIWGATRLETAREYFDHAVEVHEYMVAWQPTLSGWVRLKLGGGYWLTKEERRRAQATLDRLKAWGAENLPVEPPQVR